MLKGVNSYVTLTSPLIEKRSCLEVIVGKSFDKHDEGLRAIRNLLKDQFHLLQKKTIQLLQAFPVLRHVPLFGTFKLFFQTAVNVPL